MPASNIFIRSGILTSILPFTLNMTRRTKFKWLLQLAYNYAEKIQKPFETVKDNRFTLNAVLPAGFNT